jgi:hypothetical protein
MIAIKKILMAKIGISKTRSLFPSKEKPAWFLALLSSWQRNHARLAFKRFSKIPILAYYFFNHGILDAN